MTDLNILNNMIKDAAKVSLIDYYGKKQVKLEEPQSPDASVTIQGMPDNSIVIKADTFRSPDSVFKGTQGECKRADFVIIADVGNKKIIIYIEMKATKNSGKEIIQQLKGSQCFVAYCQTIGQSFWNAQNFLNGYEHRFVSIGHINIPKRKTRILRQTGVHDHPDRLLKIDWPRYLQFNHLAGVNRQ